MLIIFVMLHKLSALPVEQEHFGDPEELIQDTETYTNPARPQDYLQGQHQQAPRESVAQLSGEYMQCLCYA